MKLRYRLLTFLTAASLAGLAGASRADEAAALTGEIQATDANALSKGQGAVTDKIVSDFQSFAGSSGNANRLVMGLRSGSEITLTAKGEPSATFTPPTRPMGYGNVSTSLALAKAQLAQQGIVDPTPTQLQTALLGGSITANGKTVDYQGILQMRADGMGWGQIAHSTGTKLGPVVSGIKAQNQHFAVLPATATQRPVAMAGARSAFGPDAQSRPDGSQAHSRGIVTAGGAPPSTAGASQGKGQDKATAGTKGAATPRGQGIVTAAGHGASPTANGVAGGKGAVVTATGSAAGWAPGGR